MYNAQHGILGYHGHAMLLSLPPVLLVWAVVTFTGSMLAYAMQDVSETVNSTGRLAAWMIFSIFLVILFLVFAALYTFSGLWSFSQRSRMSWIWRPAVPGRSVVSVVQRSYSKSKTSEIMEMV